MNSEKGGTLLIGVSDDGYIVGINDEYEIVNKQKKNWDGYELFLTHLLLGCLSLDSSFNYFEIIRHTVDGKDICCIMIKPTPEPVYVNGEMYVRVGNHINKMSVPDAIAYVKRRWKNQ